MCLAFVKLAGNKELRYEYARSSCRHANSHSQRKTRNKPSVQMPASKLRKSIADLLVAEGYLTSAEVSEAENGKKVLDIELKYYSRQRRY